MGWKKTKTGTQKSNVKQWHSIDTTWKEGKDDFRISNICTNGIYFIAF